MGSTGTDGDRSRGMIAWIMEEEVWTGAEQLDSSDLAQPIPPTDSTSKDGRTIAL